MNLNDPLDPQLANKFNLFRDVPPAKPDDLVAGRFAFLMEAQQISRDVIKPEKRRHIGWINKFPTIFLQRKEGSTMLSTFATILLTLTLLFGSGGITLAAAQSSLPDQPLYGVKVWSEEALLGLTADRQAAQQLTLDFTTRRAEEFQAMLEMGNIPDNNFQYRYQNQIEQAIQLAAELPDEQAVSTLVQVKQRLQNQQQMLQTIRANTNLQDNAVLTQTLQMLQTRLQLVQDNQTDPARLRERIRQREQQIETEQPTMPADLPTQTGESTITVEVSTPVPASTQVNMDCPNCTPAKNKPDEAGGNPWAEGTPTPGSGYGPGPGTGSCTPDPGHSLQMQMTKVTGSNSNQSDSASSSSGNDSQSGNDNGGNNDNGNGGGNGGGGGGGGGNGGGKN